MMQVYPLIKPSVRRAGLNKARLPKQKKGENIMYKIYYQRMLNTEEKFDAGLPVYENKKKSSRKSHLVKCDLF